MDRREMERRIADAFEFVQRVAHRPERYPDTAVLFLLDPREIASLVTKERLRLLHALQGKEHPSIVALARSLGRDVSRVRKDLLVLERFGLARVSKRGNRVVATPAATGIYIPLLSGAPRRAKRRQPLRR